MPTTMTARYSVVAGCCDFFTGLLLVAVPSMAIDLMKVSVVPGNLLWLRWIGVFVASVGASYALPFLFPAPLRSVAQVTVLMATTLVRLSVAALVFSALTQKILDFSWISVGLTDAGLAAFQCFLLIKFRPFANLAVTATQSARHTKEQHS